MFHLIGQEEVDFIFTGPGDSAMDIASRAVYTYRNRPTFFTAYQSPGEFAGEIIAPILYPLAGSVVCVYSLFAAAIAAAVCVGSLLVAAGAALFGSVGVRDEALEVSSLALQFAGVALLTSAVSALLAIVSLPHSLLSLASRSVFTLGKGAVTAVKAVADCLVGSDDDSDISPGYALV